MTELLERVIKVEEDIARTMKRLDTSFDRRFDKRTDAIQMQINYNQKIIFKIIIPLVVGLVLLAASQTEPGSTVVTGAGNVIKNFVGME